MRLHTLILPHENKVTPKLLRDTKRLPAKLKEKAPDLKDMKTDLKPILAAALKMGAEFRIKSKYGLSTFIINQETLDEFESLTFDPDWVKTAQAEGTATYFSESAEVPHRDDRLPQPDGRVP